MAALEGLKAELMAREEATVLFAPPPGRWPRRADAVGGRVRREPERHPHPPHHEHADRRDPMSTDLITEHLDLWTSAVTYNNGKGRGNNGEPELTGINKLRELILELAVR